MKYIGFKASDKELELLALIMTVQKRKTKSDTLRALVLEKAEFFLQKNMTVVVKQTTPQPPKEDNQ